MSRSEKILIIGAGAAGLSAAAELRAAGLEIEVLEARDRAGGRVHTVTVPGFEGPVELGAEFVHGKPPETYRPEAVEADGDFRILRQGRVREMPDFWERVGKVLSSLDESRSDDPSGDQSFDEACRSRSGADIQLARDFVESFHAAPASEVSARALRLGEEQAERLEIDHAFRLPGGYRPLLERLISEAGPIRLAACVRELSWSGSEVVARLERGELARGTRALITLPVGVWQSGLLKLSPEPVGRREALSKMGMGEVIKLSLGFRKCFWDFGFLSAPESPFAVFWSDPARPLVNAWAGGPKAKRLLALSETAQVEQAMETLARATGLDPGSVRSHLAWARSKNWSSDPYSRGAYSFIRRGGLECARVLAQPVEGTLFFAGESTHLEGQSATVDGAIATGRRAAREILEAIGTASRRKASPSARESFGS